MLSVREILRQLTLKFGKTYDDREVFEGVCGVFVCIYIEVWEDV
jgi:hypothetical protein